jgi:hypothetical protein
MVNGFEGVFQLSRAHAGDLRRRKNQPDIKRVVIVTIGRNGNQRLMSS